MANPSVHAPAGKHADNSLGLTAQSEGIPAGLTLAAKGAPDILTSGSHYAGFQCALNSFHLPKLEQPPLSEALISLPRNHLTFDGYFEGKFRRFEWRPGLAFLIPPGETATYWYSEPALRMHLRLDKGQLAKHAATRGYDPARLVFPWAFACADPQLTAIGDALHAELEMGMPSGRLFGESLREAICAHILARYGGVAVERTRFGLGSTNVRRIVEFVESQLAESLTIDELARETGYSPWHFQRLFKESFGEPVHAYVVRRRTDRAVEMLRRGLKPSYVAAEVGFANAAHLRRWIQKHYGVTLRALLPHD